MKNKRLIEDIRDRFGNRTTFSRKELLDFFLEDEPELNNQTFGWRIFNLKKANVIRSTSRGIYTLNKKLKFQPEVNKEIRKINRKVKEILQFFGRGVAEGKHYCIWETRWLVDFMVHLPFRNYLVLEVQEESAQYVYNRLGTISNYEVYLTLNNKKPVSFPHKKKKTIIIKPLFSRAPVQRIEEIPTTTIEKLLVDIYCEKIFSFYQGSELENIYKHIIDKYEINYTKLLNYAARRRMRNEILQFIKLNSSAGEELI